MFLIENFAGSFREIGLQKGRTYRHLIRNLFYEGYFEHHPHGIERVKKAYIESHLEVLERYAPEYIEELKGTSEGCMLDFDELILMSIYWQQFRGPMFQPPDSCFSIGVLDGEGLPILGSIWDSPRINIVWCRTAPEGRFSHLCLTIPGTPFSERGINEKGLVVSGSSISAGGFSAEHPLLQHSIGQRLVLEKCATVEEAMDFLKTLPVVTTYIAADAEGGLAGIQITRAGYEIYRPEGDFLILANHIASDELVQKTKAAGFYEEPNANSLKRVATAEKMAAGAERPLNIDFIKKVLTSHEGYPDSICRDGNGSTMIASPARDRGTILAAERFPCRSPLERIGVKPD